MTLDELTFFDAGLFIGALLSGDPRHAEAYPLVEAARRGTLCFCQSKTGPLDAVGWPTPSHGRDFT